jgi:hypothetical protein
VLNKGETMGKLTELRKEFDTIPLVLAVLNFKLASHAANEHYDQYTVRNEVLSPLGDVIRGFGDVLTKLAEVIDKVESGIGKAYVNNKNDLQDLKSLSGAFGSDVTRLGNLKQTLLTKCNAHENIVSDAEEFGLIISDIGRQQNLLHLVHQRLPNV